MKPIDPRDPLFKRLCDAHLKTLGFRRRGRKAHRDLEGGLVQTVELESGTWNTAEQIDFGITVLVRHPAFRPDPFSDRPSADGGDVLVQLSVRRRADPPHQRWTLHLAGDHDTTLQQVAETFAAAGVDLVHRTATLEGIEAICAEYGPFRFFEARAWCLRKLGRAAASAQVIREALANAPHDGARDHASRLLQRYGV